MIDAHVHVFPGAEADALRFGVTTELDMYSTRADFPKWKAQRQSLARTSEAAREAIECGSDGLAHLFPDTVADPDFAALAYKHRIFIETTDSVWAGSSGLSLARDLAADPRVAPYLSDVRKRSLNYETKKPMPAFFDNMLASTRLLHQAGIPLLVSTDAPNPATAHGVTVHEELQIYVKAGYTPQEALHAATARPSEIFALGERGHVWKGERADLWLVAGDPTTDIADTLSIERIWKNGYAVDRTAPK